MFKKGDERINRKGRPPGQSQKVKELREKIFFLVEKNLGDLEAELKKIKGKDKFLVLDRLLRHCLPPMPTKKENLLDEMTETDLRRLIEYLRKENIENG